MSENGIPKNEQHIIYSNNSLYGFLYGTISDDIFCMNWINNQQFESYIIVYTMMVQYSYLAETIGAAIKLLDTLWICGNDEKFNNAIKNIHSQIEPIAQLSPFHIKITTYCCIFSIKNDLSKSKDISNIINNHICDLWRILLLELKVNVQSLIINELKTKQRSTGSYINSLQRVFTNKNRAAKCLRAKIKMLTKLVKELSSDKPIYDYELIPNDTSSGFSKYLSNWF